MMRTSYEAPDDWRESANCLGVDPEAFYSEGHHAREQSQMARRICAACPVMAECRQWAIRNGETWGVWGGMTQTELRRQSRRFANRQAAA